MSTVIFNREINQSLGLDGYQKYTTGLSAILLISVVALIPLNMNGILSSKITEIAIFAIGLSSFGLNLLGLKLDQRKWQVLIISLLSLSLAALGGFKHFSHYLSNQSFQIGALAIGGATAILSFVGLLNVLYGMRKLRKS